MRYRKNDSINENCRLLSDDGVCEYLNLGKSAARAFCEEIGAVVRFGRRRLNDKQIIDKHIDEMLHSNNED